MRRNASNRIGKLQDPKAPLHPSAGNHSGRAVWNPLCMTVCASCAVRRVLGDNLGRLCNILMHMLEPALRDCLDDILAQHLRAANRPDLAQLNLPAQTGLLFLNSWRKSCRRIWRVELFFSCRMISLRARL